MGLISNIGRGAANFRADVSGSPGPTDDFWYGPVGAGSASGIRVSPESSKRIAAVLACVSIIARNVAMMPARIFTDLSDGGKRVVPKHPLSYILTVAPNLQQTPFEFFSMMQSHVELRGNAFAEIIPGPRGAVDQLVPMHPDRVQVEQLATGRLRYQYNDPLTKQTRLLTQDEVFHLRNLSEDGITGESTIALGVDVIGNAAAAQDYSSRFFRNDGRPGGVIKGANFRTKQDEESFRESWQRSQTAANRHKVAILPPGLEYEAIGVNPSEAQLLDARKFSRIEICSLFGVPPHLIGETEKAATYASVEQFNIMFATQCLTPRVVMWEQTIQRDLIQNPRYYTRFSMAALLRGDMTSRYDAYQVAIQNGWMSPNDVREAEDLNPIEGGNTYWRQLNMAPLTQVTTPEQETGSTDGAEADLAA